MVLRLVSSEHDCYRRRGVDGSAQDSELTGDWGAAGRMIQKRAGADVYLRETVNVACAKALRELAGVELVRAATDDHGIYIFKHALVQETVHATLLKNENRRLHRLVAFALHDVNSDRLDEYA